MAPNGDIGTDAAVDTFVHELAEAITDRMGASGWTDTRGEIGDKCAYKYSDLDLHATSTGMTSASNPYPTG